MSTSHAFLWRALPVLLLFLMLSSTLFLFSPQVKASTLATHAPILINGNSGFISSNGVTGGSGTASDPYMIQGWSMNLCWNCYSTSIGIRVANTTAYFQIFNVSVSDQNQGSPSNGIVLDNVTNGRIDSSFVDVESAFNGPGIIVASSRNVVINANNAAAGGCTGSSNCSIYDTVLLSSSTNVTVSGNSIRAYASGPVLGVEGSSNVSILHNTINTGFGPPPLGAAYGSSNGIVVSSSGNIRISRNSVVNGACGKSIVIGGSSSTQISENNVTVPYSGGCGPYHDGSGIVLQSTTGARVYHNNLVNNSPQASDNNPGKNQWDNGYPSGGNYLSDYAGVDNCSGPQQNMCPSPDGIGDTPYQFNYAQDRYPLIGPFRSVSASLSVHGSITIVGDGGFTSSNGVTGGSGTDRDPYVISSWSITGNSVYVSVSNTTAFFIIQNVALDGAYGGITLSNVTNGAVENAHVYESQTYAGISIKASKNILVAYDSSSAGGCGPNEGCGGDGLVILNSVNVVVAHNSLPGTQGENLQIANSNNVTVTDNAIGKSTSYGMHVLNSGNVTISSNSFEATSLEISYPVAGEDPYRITTDNLVNGKPLYYYDDCGSGGLSLDHVSMGQLIIFNCSNVRLSNLIVTGTDVGITMNHVQRVLIDNVNASADRMEGLHVTESSNVVVVNSDFSLVPFSFGNLYPFQLGILVQQSNDTSVSGSRFYNDPIGMMLQSSFNATISGNTFPSDYTMICLQSSTGIHVFHNDFFGNGGYYCTSDTEPGHFWDNGYPSGGNYWSSYTGTDPDSDGVGDTPQPVTGGVYQDNYPLMKPFVAAPIISVVMGTDGNLYSSVSRPDGSWNSWHSLSGSTPSTPTICRAGPDRVELVVRGMDNVIYLKSNINGTWSGSWESLGGQTPDQPACAVVNGTLYVVVRGMSGALYYQTVDLPTDTKSGWTYLGGSSPSAPALCVSGPSSLELLVRGDDNGLYHKSFYRMSWSSVWDKNPTGVIFDTPACALLGGSLYVGVRGAAQSLWTTTFNLSTRTWAISWTNLQGSTPSVPALVSTPSLGRLDLIVTGMDNVVYHKSFVNGSWSSTWDSPNGVTLSTPATVSDGRDLRIVVVGTDGSLVSNLLPLSASSWTMWTSMNGSTNSVPSAG